MIPERRKGLAAKRGRKEALGFGVDGYRARSFTRRMNAANPTNCSSIADEHCAARVARSFIIRTRPMM